MRKKPAVVSHDPAAAWKVPAHVLARAAVQPCAQDAARAEQTLRGHTMMVTARGDLLSVVMSGYLSEPGVPHAFMANTQGCPLREAVRAPWAVQYPQLAPLAVHSAADLTQPFNLFGSLLAAEVGFALEPLHGVVFFSHQPDPDGVVGKLPVKLKELISFKLMTLESVAAKVRPDFVGEQDYQVAWARIRTLLAAAHDMRTASPDPAKTTGPGDAVKSAEQVT